MPAPVEVLTLRGAFGPDDAARLTADLDAAFARGARWVAVEVVEADPVDADVLAGVTAREGVVVCGGVDPLLTRLAASGVVATRRLLDVHVAAAAGRGDALKRRIELLELPRL